MSEVVVSKIHSQASDQYLCAADEPGSILQVKMFEYTSVHEDNANNEKERDMPGILGNGGMFIECEVGNRILVECNMQLGQESTWRSIFMRVYWNGGMNRAPSGQQVSGGNGANTTSITNSARPDDSLLWAGGSGHNYTQNYSGMLHTANWTVLTPPVINKGAVNFRMTQVGHNQGNTLHLNQNNTTNSGGANNAIQCASTVILKEVYYP
jgi:hypothetical protein